MTDMSKSGGEHEGDLGLRNVVRLGYVSLSTDLSTEMILGVLPFFIIRDLGGSAAVLGLIEGLAEAANYLFRVFSGLLTDKIARRKPLVLLGYGLSSISKPIFAVTSSWSQALLVRVTDRAGKGIRTSPRDALISDSVARSEAGRAFGIQGALDQVGAVLGPIIAFAVIPFIGIRGVFWLSFIPAALSVLILIFFVRDYHGPVRERSIFKNAREVLDRQFVLLLLALGVFSVGAYDFSFILLKAGSLGIDTNYIPLVYAVLNIGTVILGVPAGILADRVGKIPVLGLGYAVFLFTSAVGFSVVGNPLFGFVIAFLFGSYLAISDTVQRAIIPDFTKPDLKGTAYAIYYTIIGIGAFVANASFGALWSNISPAAAFQFSVATATVGIIALIVFIRMTHESLTGK